MCIEKQLRKNEKELGDFTMLSQRVSQAVSQLASQLLRSEQRASK
jgi:hypothetical protein